MATKVFSVCTSRGLTVPVTLLHMHWHCTAGPGQRRIRKLQRRIRKLPGPRIRKLTPRIRKLQRRIRKLPGPRIRKLTPRIRKLQRRFRKLPGPALGFGNLPFPPGFRNFNVGFGNFQALGLGNLPFPPDSEILQRRIRKLPGPRIRIRNEKQKFVLGTDIACRVLAGKFRK